MIPQRESSRIGGEFELRVEDLLATPSADPPSFRRAHEIWLDTGRSAITLAAREILRRGGAKRAWLPAYCCESIAQSVREAGFETTYYPVGERLQADAQNLPVPASSDTLLFIHYFGHRNAVMQGHALTLRRDGVWVIEDCVQAGLSTGVGGAGHYAVASYRKLLPQPDGALLGTDTAVSEPLQEPDELFISQRLLGKLLRGSGAEAGYFLPLFASSEDALRQRVVPRRQSWIGNQIMLRTDRDAVAWRRRANWRLLSSRLTALARPDLIEPIFTTIEPGEVPLGFAVRVGGGRRDALRTFLRKHQVYCPVHWPLPHVPAESRFFSEHELANSMLTLPIDQRMNETHVAQLAGLVGEFHGEAS